MFTIRDYQTPNKIKFVSLRTERTRKAKRAERLATLKRRTFTTLAIIFFVLAFGFVGEQDRQYELINNGYTAEKVSK